MQEQTESEHLKLYKCQFIIITLVIVESSHKEDIYICCCCNLDGIYKHTVRAELRHISVKVRQLQSSRGIIYFKTLIHPSSLYLNYMNLSSINILYSVFINVVTNILLNAFSFCAFFALLFTLFLLQFRSI